MSYENYVSSLKKNIVEINRAVKGGTVLSRLENFDYLFKKELAIAEGVRSKRSLLNRIVNNVTDVDYRTANFYAEGFSSIMRTVRDGYSVKGISKQFKHFIRVANSKYICSSVVVALVSDLNGKITVKIGTEYSEEETHEINNIGDYARVALHLLSLLGSLEEENNGYRDWFNTYLMKELTRVELGYEAEPFIERESVAIDLKSYMKGDIKNRSVKEGNGRVIHLAK